MKKSTLVILLSTTLITSVIFLGAFCMDTADDAHGPAPNSGDGYPDGSGFNRDSWPNEDSTGIGPAPNSGDGVPDGSGF
jgi:hypothetical protein